MNMIKFLDKKLPLRCFNAPSLLLPRTQPRRGLRRVRTVFNDRACIPFFHK